MYYVYVLRYTVNNKGKFYIGYCDSIKNRLKRHKSGDIKTTAKCDKIELVYYEACLNKTDAIKRENQLKTGFGRGYIKKRLKSYLEKRE